MQESSALRIGAVGWQKLQESSTFVSWRRQVEASGAPVQESFSNELVLQNVQSPATHPTQFGWSQLESVRADDNRAMNRIVGIVLDFIFFPLFFFI